MTATFLAAAAAPASALVEDPATAGAAAAALADIQIVPLGGPTAGGLPGGATALVVAPGSWECDFDPLDPLPPAVRERMPKTPRLGTSRLVHDETEGGLVYRVSCEDPAAAAPPCRPQAWVTKTGGSGSIQGTARCHKLPWGAPHIASCTVSGTTGTCYAQNFPVQAQKKVCIGAYSGTAATVSCQF